MIGSKGYTHIFALAGKERTGIEILNSIDDPYPFKTWLNNRLVFLKQISKGQMDRLNI